MQVSVMEVLAYLKMLKAFINIAENYGLDFGLLKETEKINQNSVKQFLDKIEEVLWINKEKTNNYLGFSL
jgi:UDPglucose 6-dehydrogenase